MSGDKLLGGPQAGIILGTGAVISRLRKNPFTRAMRVDKLTLAALEATLRIYLDPSRALKEIPVLAMLSTPPEAIRLRAEAVARALSEKGLRATVAQTNASVGGGAFPTAKIPSFAVTLEGNAGPMEERLRSATVPVIGRISDDTLFLDLRSVAPAEDTALAEMVARALA
jgi:L-seryl-tRNA(Ser) seleniumtransferase